MSNNMSKDMKALVEIRLTADQTEGTKATVAQWLKNEGDSVVKDEPIIELETDKVMMEVIAPSSGILHEILMQQGEEVTEKKILGTISEEAVSKALNEQEDDKEDSKKQVNTQGITPNSANDLPRLDPTAGPSYPPSTFVSPAVRRLSQQHDLNLSQISGSGKNSRITTRDIKNFLDKNADRDFKPVYGQSDAGMPKTSFNEVTPIAAGSEMIPHTTMRKKIAEHMQHSVQTAPHVTSVFDLDMSAIINHRKANKAAFEAQGAKLTFTAYFVAASVMAIKHQPKVNSQFHEEALEVFKHVNLGIGTALGDGGLIVPVIQQCQNMNLLQIAHALTEMTTKARNNQLTQKDVQGGTFTISNHGVSGSLVATPIIINQPQSAILGVGKMEKRVVVQDVNGQDAMVIKPMCYISLTIDHRSLDAHQTNDFLSHFKQVLESWD
ncbi:dihydrolipoamide acetyltransferase family protein [Marinicella rhabdoformis]|uniref:dihydrolipoamide acetyltransferase family protein n=1 Tax=Marinicella rhabdoformis TaxID=2580566 RepID=UPI001FE647E3|nr:2-oxo acid dehydrogenase subunit E2 [Marinicella rhabdoformis]